MEQVRRAEFEESGKVEEEDFGEMAGDDAVVLA